MLHTVSPCGMGAGEKRRCYGMGMTAEQLIESLQRLDPKTRVLIEVTSVGELFVVNPRVRNVSEYDNVVARSVKDSPAIVLARAGDYVAERA
jgi:hypothetical protein